MSDKDDAEKIYSRLTGWMDGAESMDLEQLREVRRMMGDNVEASERHFLSVLNELKAGLSQPEGVVVPIGGLLAKAREHGLDAVALADKTGMSIVLVTKLDRRLLTFKSIPTKLVKTLADALQTTVAAIMDYLQQPQTFAMGALFRAVESPRLPEQQSFFDAVRTDKSMSEDRRAALLALEEPQGS